MNRKSLGIYIHIPFCVQKCLYCDFISGPATFQTMKDYVNCLINEIKWRSRRLSSLKEAESFTHHKTNTVEEASDYIVNSIFIGGGTPSVLEADWIADILGVLRETFNISGDCECSIEVNPGTVDRDKLAKYRKAGINRLSIGLQSCNRKELQMLGRIHDYQAFEETYYEARKAGFDNINVDLMSAIPGQTEESFMASLQQVMHLSPEHISVYSLIVEEGTPFSRMHLELPSEETERQIYHAAGAILKEAGYCQYEISNYAKEGKECRHNIRYWRCEEYIGFGVAAASYFNSKRWKNTEEIKTYLDNMSIAPKDTEYPNREQSDFYCERELLSDDDKCAEFMFMGLRMNEGVSEAEFQKRFGCTMNEKYDGIIEKHVKSGLLNKTGEHIMLTEQGRDICNYVMADFLL